MCRKEKGLSKFPTAAPGSSRFCDVRTVSAGQGRAWIREQTFKRMLSISGDAQIRRDSCLDERMTRSWTPAVSQIGSLWFRCFPLRHPSGEKQKKKRATAENNRTVKCILIPAGDTNPVQRQQGNGLVRADPANTCRWEWLSCRWAERWKLI